MLQGIDSPYHNTTLCQPGANCSVSHFDVLKILMKLFVSAHTKPSWLKFKNYFILQGKFSLLSGKWSHLETKKELRQWVLKSLTFSLLPEVCQAPWTEQGRGWAWQSRIPEWFASRLVLLALKEHKKYEKPKGFNCLNSGHHLFLQILRKKKTNLHIITDRYYSDSKLHLKTLWENIVN